MNQLEKESIELLIENNSLKLELRENKNVDIVSEGYVIRTPSGNYHLDRDSKLAKVYKHRSTAEKLKGAGSVIKVRIVAEL